MEKINIKNLFKNLFKSMFSGFIATIVLSLFMIIKNESWHYATTQPKLPGSPVVKGISFGVIAWLLMMFIPMPMSVEGLFGLKLGMMAPIITLVLHIIYGAVIGFTYKLLQPK